MRRISRILKLGKNLTQQLQCHDLAKAAQSLSEFSELWSSESAAAGNLLADVEAVEAEKRLFRQARKDVERSADAMLTSGLEVTN